MRNIMLKEIKLSASPLAYLFILFGLMFLIPGYPILCGAFFVTLGLFHSFQAAREANDIVFSALLPIAKKDVVKGKFAFVCFIEGCAMVLLTITVCLRMTLLSEATVYLNNALMNANFFALGAALFIFGLFNRIFVCGFFRTAYKLGRPFITYIITAFFMIIVFEALHHIPGFEKLNAFGTDHISLQLIILFSGMIIYLFITLFAYRKASNYFEHIDL